MIKFLVAGLINIETTLRIDSFPLNYNPVNYPFFGIDTTVTGTGYNIAKSLSTFGHNINLVSLIGNDPEAESVQNELKKQHIKSNFVLKNLEATSQAVIIYDDNGTRQIHCDLKNIQETEYDVSLFKEALSECDMVILGNINFVRPFINIVKESEKLIAVDVHVLSNTDDEYNRDFLEYSDILFMSNEAVIGREKEFVTQLISKYDKRIIVVGMGAKGALLYYRDDNYMEILPAVKTRAIINTVGAGDALFSCFLHYFQKNKDPYISLKKAITFASYKIGEKGAAHGFLSENKLEILYEELLVRS